MSEPLPAPAISRFCEAWAESMTDILKSLGVASPKTIVSDAVAMPAIVSDAIAAPAPSPEESDKRVPIQFTGGGCLKGHLIWLGEKPAALQLGQLLMSEPLDPAAAFSETHRESFAELLRQVAGYAATAWKQETGTDTEIAFQSGAGPSLAHSLGASFRIAGEKFPEVTLHLLLNEDLCTALAALPLPKAGAASPESASPPPESEKKPDQEDQEEAVEEPGEEVSSQLGTLPANLELVLNVELEASIRFGEREMLLRDVIGLMPGTIVELNKLVNEPADLFVACRAVAQGELVLVDGNLGLRITHVAGIPERAAALAAPRRSTQP